MTVINLDSPRNDTWLHDLPLAAPPDAYKSDTASAVFTQLARNYPNTSINWVTQDATNWRLTNLPLNLVDFDDVNSWAANHQHARVEHFADELTTGAPPRPAVGVKVPGKTKVKIIDGHHRALAAREKGVPVRCYVGDVPNDNPDSPWFQAHLYQEHQGKDPANKSWATAWETELRGHGGEWVHDDAATTAAVDDATRRYSYDGEPHPTAESVAAAKTMLTTTGLTPQETHVATQELAAAIDRVPEMRDAVARRWKVRFTNLPPGTDGETGPYPGGKDEMRLSKRLVNSKAPTANEEENLSQFQHYNVRTGMNNAGDYGALRATINHEFGHMIFDESVLITGKKHFPAEYTARLQDAIEAPLSDTPPRSDDEANAIVAQRISQYGATDFQEEIAEAYLGWAVHGEGADSTTYVQQAGLAAKNIIVQEFQRNAAQAAPATKAEYDPRMFCTGYPGHPTTIKAAKDNDEAVAFLLIRAPNPDGKWRYLLQQRVNGEWGLPGGHLHVGETPWDAAVRESTEEMGMDLPPLTRRGQLQRDDDDNHVTTFFTETPEIFQPTPDGVEATGYAWLRKKEVPDLPLIPAMETTWDDAAEADWLKKDTDPGLTKDWRDAYLHEARGAHGEWLHGLEAPPGISYPGTRLTGDAKREQNYLTMMRSSVSPENVAIAEKMIPTDNLTPAEHEITALELARNLDNVGDKVLINKIAKRWTIRAVPARSLNNGHTYGMTGPYGDSDGPPYEVHFDMRLAHNASQMRTEFQQQEDDGSFTRPSPDLPEGTAYDGLRYTIAHEFGHVLMDELLLAHKGPDHKNDVRGLKKTLGTALTGETTPSPSEVNIAAAGVSSYGFRGGPPELIAETYAAQALHGTGANHSQAAPRAGAAFLSYVKERAGDPNNFWDRLDAMQNKSAPGLGDDADWANPPPSWWRCTGLPAPTATQKGWASAWEHEERGWHGRWVHPGDEGFRPTDPTHVILNPAPGVKDLTSKGRPDGAGTPADPIDVEGNIDRAVRLLAEHKSVRLNQPDEVTLITAKISQLADDYKKRGGHLPTIDFGNLTIRGTNLFTAETQGIPRIKMPQLGGIADKPGTPAAYQFGVGHYADMVDDFKKKLHDDGIPTHDETVPANHLRATQDQIDGGKVASLARAWQSGNAFVRGMMSEPIWVTRDNYVIDGHHRWAAAMVLDAAAGNLAAPIEVRKIDMDIGAAIPYANQFAADMGLEAQAVGEGTALVAGKTMEPDLVKVGPHGYIHGWIYVGDADSEGEEVTHPDLGHGQVTTATSAHANVKFSDGSTATFDRQEPADPADLFFGDPMTGDPDRADGLVKRIVAPQLTGPAVTGVARDSLIHYVGPEANAEINGSLRESREPRTVPGVELASQVEGDITHLDHTLSQHTVKKDVTVYRGIAMTPALARNMKPGATFTDKAYVSTTVMPEVAEEFAKYRTGADTHFGPNPHPAGGKQVVLHVHVPAGAHMIHGQGTIGEYVLPRNSRFHVDGTEANGALDVSLLPDGTQ
jgi:8-oxo-dGTP pyrophosphatase MutT (NUDIX family)